MPITLIRNTKDNAMHGSDNDRYTGCRMKMQGGSWYTREGELKDITDLTCDRCKEVFATKMIRESNKEELRIAKEEKKRFMREKKLGKVREATYEEYMMNREAEASARRDSRDDAAVSESLQMLRDAIPAEQVPQAQPAGSVQFQSPFNPYQQPSVSAPQAQFNPYQQPAVSAPQAQFNPYQQPAVTAPQAPFNPYQQSVVSAPQAPFDPYAMAQQPEIFNPFGGQAAQSVQSTAAPSGSSLQLENIQPPVQESAPVDDGPVPSFQEYTGAASISTPAESSPAAPVASDDDFLSQFMVKPAAPAPEPVSAPASSVTADSIVNATDDILSQFNIGSKLAESAPAAPSPAPAARADASSFFSDSIPVVGAEYAGASSVNSAVTEFGSLNIVEPPKDEFIVPDVPVYQPGGNTYNPNAYSSQNNSSFDDIAVPDVSSLSPAQSASNVSLQFADLASADVHQSSINEIEEMNDTEPDFGFDSLTSESALASDDIMSGFGDIPSVPTVNSFDTPVQSVSPVSFEAVSPVQPSAPVSFEPVQPVQPAAPISFEAVSPVQSSVSFEPVQPVQPSAPVSFEAVSPVQPSVPVQPAMPQQTNPFAMPQNGMYQQPAQNVYQNPYAAPQQPNSFQMPQGYGMPAQQPQFSQQPQFTQPAAPAPKPVQPAPVFADQGNTADSIEEALRQLGADVSGFGGNENSQVSDKEEIVPDFVAYVPSSSKVLHTAPPSQSVSSGNVKRPMSAREAKQLAKIDAKFKKDLISRGFNPNEIKNGRRGK